MERYKSIEEIGDGTCGIVYKAINLETSEIVAVKKMKRKYYVWEECMNLREVKSLQKLNHPNIIKLKEIVRENNELFFIFEYMEHNLYDIMRERQRPFIFICHHLSKLKRLGVLKAELWARGGGGSSVELQVLRERIAWLEATNQDLCREIHIYRSRGIAINHSEMDTKVQYYYPFEKIHFVFKKCILGHIPLIKTFCNSFIAL